MLNLRTNQVVTRGQFVLAHMPHIVVQKITEQALRQGYARGVEPALEIPNVLDEEACDVKLHGMMAIDGCKVPQGIPKTLSLITCT